MENLWKHLIGFLLFVITVSAISIISGIVLDACDNEQWKQNRNKHRIYDPIDLKKEEEDDVENYITNTQ